MGTPGVGVGDAELLDLFVSAPHNPLDFKERGKGCIPRLQEPFDNTLVNSHEYREAIL